MMDVEFGEQLEALNTVIERALADSEAGRGKSADEVFDRLDAKYRGTVFCQ